MNRQRRHRLEVLHRLPRRLRVSVQPADGELIAHLVDEVCRVRGVTQVAIGASRKNLVIHFDPAEVLEDSMLMRLALAYSARVGYQPVALIKDRQRRPLNRGALAAGTTSGVASFLAAIAPNAILTSMVGWSATALTLTSMTRSIVDDLQRAKARPEALSLLYLLDRLDSPGRGHGAMLSWLLYHGKELAERIRGGAAAGLELQPIRLRGAVGDDSEGHHIELVTRPLRDRGVNEGKLLTPATLATAIIGYLTFSLKQGWIAQRAD